MRRFILENPLIKFFYHTVIIYKVPCNLNYLWNFGFLAFCCLFIQIISGVLLAMHYIPDINLAFNSIEHIMRDVPCGWLLRYVHANGASFFFFIVYIHIFRGLYYGSYVYPRNVLWILGVIIFLLMILTAFMGYVLPWGQMSLWAATVITNLASAIPVIGKNIVIWLWGGFAVDNPTLHRFFSLHYLLPFIILGLVILHIAFLHLSGSNNPLGLVGDFVLAESKSNVNGISFSPAFTIKDVFGFLLMSIVFMYFIMYIPNYAGHSDNYVMGNPLVTPAHIVPEWYFLPFYAMLRSIPDKLGGVIVLLCSILILAFLPLFIKHDVRSNAFKPGQKFCFWFILSIYLILGWLGGMPIATPYYQIGQIVSGLYFGVFLIVIPVISTIEHWFFGYYSFTK